MPDRRGAAFTFLVLLLPACDGARPPAPAARARPVTVVTLRSEAPALSDRTTGVAAPHREEGLGFEVRGRLMHVAHVGLEVDGPTLGGAGEQLQPGAVLASIDPARYRQALEATRLRLQSTMRELEAQTIDVEAVASADLERARAEAAAADQEFRGAEAQERVTRASLARTSDLVRDGISSQADLDRDQASFDQAAAQLESARNRRSAADAAVAKAEASIKLKQANLEQTRARIAELEQAVVQAQQDVDDCSLRAPFAGRVTVRHRGLGGFVSPGEPVLTLTMMDPIKVTVTVDAETSRKLVPGAPVQLLPDGLGRFPAPAAVFGMVYEKAEVADAATRTYRVDVIVRNVRRDAATRDPDGQQVTVIDEVRPVIRRLTGGGGPLFVPVEAIAGAGPDAHVLRLPGLRLGSASSVDMARVFRPERVAVAPGDQYFSPIRYTFRSVADGSALQEGDLLVLDPKPEHASGVMLSAFDWLLRPGDIVPVRLELGALPSGYYVPSEAIRSSNGRTSVMVVGDGDRVREVAVTVHETASTRRRIEGEGLADGLRVVKDGLHYVAGGDVVTVVEEFGK